MGLRCIVEWECNLGEHFCVCGEGRGMSRMQRSRRALAAIRKVRFDRSIEARSARRDNGFWIAVTRW